MNKIHKSVNSILLLATHTSHVYTVLQSFVFLLLLFSSFCTEEAVPSHLVHTSPKAFTIQLGHCAVVEAIINAPKCNLGIWSEFWCCSTSTRSTIPVALFLVWLWIVYRQSHKWVVQMTSGALSSWVASFPSSFGGGLAPHGHLNLRDNSGYLRYSILHFFFYYMPVTILKGNLEI